MLISSKWLKSLLSFLADAKYACRGGLLVCGSTLYLSPDELHKMTRANRRSPTFSQPHCIQMIWWKNVQFQHFRFINLGCQEKEEKSICNCYVLQKWDMLWCYHHWKHYLTVMFHLFLLKNLENITWDEQQKCTLCQLIGRLSGHNSNPPGQKHNLRKN